MRENAVAPDGAPSSADASHGPRPRVSVLLPCYNGAQYVEAAIGSILAQTFTDFELIVVDDGSTDESPAIIARCARQDARMRVLTRQNGGIVSALNAGLAWCQGEYVARMDADDVSYPQRLARQVDWLDSHPDCVLVGGYAVSDLVPTAQSGRTTGGPYKRTDLSRFPPKIAVAVHPLVTIRRAALAAIGGYRADYPHAEDYDLFIRLSALGTIDNPPEDMLFYRRHDDAVSIRHVDLQEESAARSEIDAMMRGGHAAPPPWLVASYVQLRRWRRWRNVDPARARTVRWRMVRGLFDIRPRTLASADYFRLRVRIAAEFQRGFRRWLAKRR